MFKTLAAVALIALAASCSKDAAEAPAVNGDATVTFSVEMPGIASRATNDGTTAQELYYAVYEAGTVGKTDGQFLFQDKQAINLSTTVNLELVADQTYDIVFWAQAANTHTPDLANKTIAMNYAAAVAGADETRDAFIGFVDNLEIKGSANETVYLKRPFAQLNVALSEGQLAAAEKAGFELKTVTVKTATHTGFSIAEGIGDATGSLQAVEFKAAEFAAFNPKQLPGTTYDWVSFNYVLPALPTDVVDVEITFTSTTGKTINVPKFTNVPIERNHRTNIVGDLLTDPAKFNVIINPIFDDEPGNIVEEPTNAAVTTAEELKAALKNSALEQIILADGVYEGVFVADSYNQSIIAANAGQATIKGKFAVANKSISFSGLNFEVSGNTSATTGHQYLDKANNYIIPMYAASVTVDNCSFSGMTDDIGAIYYYANTSASATPEKLIVKNSTFDGGRAIRSRANVSVTNCKFYNLLNPCVGLLGFGDSAISGEVVFTGNTSDKFIDGIEIKTSNYVIKNIDFNVGGNVNCNTIAYDSKNLSNLKADTFTYSGEVKNIVPSGTVVGASNVAELNAALADGASEVMLSATTYDMTQIAWNGNAVTLNGVDGTVLNTTNAPKYVHTSGNITFNNVKIVIKSDGEYYDRGIVNAGKNIYNECDFEGIATNYGVCVYNDCTFTNNTSGKYAAWVYNGNATYNGCEFYGVDRAAKVYTEAGNTATAAYNDCKFVAQTANKTAVEIDSSNNDGKNIYYTVTIVNPTIQNMGQPEHYGTQYFNMEGNSVMVIYEGKTYVKGNAAATAAISKGGEVVMGPGAYSMPSIGKDVTISGAADAVITINKPNLTGSSVVTLNGVTVKGSGYSTGMQHCNKVIYNNVKVIGEMCLYGNEVQFNECDFELAGGQYIWTYGAAKASFVGCDFQTAGKAILIYNEGAGASDVTVSGCEFFATAGAKAGAIANQNCAAIEIDNYAKMAHKLTTSGNTYEGGAKFSGEWRIKNYVADAPVTVNGVEYTQIAIDGKLMTKNAQNEVTVL
ncbi:MAG: hypothetical protein IJN55_05335 [Alistipes sp.]|nr:hypothetical protein [Alistipes sp.]